MKYKPLLDKKTLDFMRIMGNHGVDKDDIKQEVLIGFEQAIKGFKEGEKALFFTFVNICIDRELSNFYKSMGREKHRILDNAISIDAMEEDDYKYKVRNITTMSYIPEQELENEESSKELLSLMESKLTEFEKKVITLKIEGFTYEEIAKKLNKSKKSVDSALQRARAKMVNFIHQEGNFW